MRIHSRIARSIRTAGFVARPCRAAGIALLLPAWLILLCGPVLAQGDGALSSEEQIVITRGATAKVRILLEEFARGPGATADDTEATFDVVFTDLDYSDLFSITAIPRMTEGDTLTASRAQMLVRGEVHVQGGEIVLRGTLESLPGRSLVFSRDYRTRPEWYREAAHRFSDDIVLYLTGRQGIARTRIAFASDRSGSKEIWVVDYDGHGRRQLTRNGTINLSPDWSPDGEKIAFVSYQEGDPNLHVFNLEEGTDRLLIGGQGVQSAPAYSPDGNDIAFNHTDGRQSQIHLVNSKGRNVRRVTRFIGISTSPSWSPDGHRLALTSDRSGTPQLFAIDVDGSGARRLTFNAKWNDQADWSPLGDRIVYSSRRGGLFRIAVMDASGLGTEEQITRGPGSDEEPCWAPDGRHVVFTSTRGGEKGLYVLDVDSGRIRRLVVGGGNHSSPAWSRVPAR